MHSVENYLVTNFNAIVLSKTTVPCISTFPRIKKLQFYFIIGVSSYKKNFLLFYIVLSILFGGVGSIKKKKVGQVRIITLVVKKQKVAFLWLFVNFYLPLLEPVDNYIKRGLFCFIAQKKTSLCCCRVSYFSFPFLIELNCICDEYEMLYALVNSYHVQIDLFIQVPQLLKHSGLFLLRMYRLPCVLKLKQYLII